MRMRMLSSRQHARAYAEKGTLCKDKDEAGRFQQAKHT
jgi:hypothetical protein